MARAQNSYLLWLKAVLQTMTPTACERESRCSINYMRNISFHHKDVKNFGDHLGGQQKQRLINCCLWRLSANHNQRLSPKRSPQMGAPKACYKFSFHGWEGEHLSSIPVAHAALTRDALCKFLRFQNLHPSGALLLIGKHWPPFT